MQYNTADSYCNRYQEAINVQRDLKFNGIFKGKHSCISMLQFEFNFVEYIVELTVHEGSINIINKNVDAYILISVHNAFIYEFSPHRVHIKVKRLKSKIIRLSQQENPT